MARPLNWAFTGLCLIILAGFLTGCHGSADRAPALAPASPKRVICGAPAVAEIVFSLGCGDRIVGVTEFTDWPPEAAEIQSIGGALSPSRERILALNPDLILSQGRAEVLEGLARQLNIAFLSLPLNSLDDLRAAITGFAGVLGVDEAGRDRLRELEDGLKAIPACGPYPVFIALGHAAGNFSGLFTAGPDTFLHELVEKAGGRNIFSDLRTPWPAISRESILRRSPALVLDIQSMELDPLRRSALLADWERLGFSADQVRILEEDYLLRPGPRAVQAAIRLSEAICK
jgi:iron complex transport system substrate-binding protein